MQAPRCSAAHPAASRCWTCSLTCTTRTIPPRRWTSCTITMCGGGALCDALTHQSAERPFSTTPPTESYHEFGRAQAPPCALTRHSPRQFTVHDSAGVSLAEAAAGVPWPPALSGPGSAARYASLVANRTSFSAGSCALTRYFLGGGAEWRGVQRSTVRLRAPPARLRAQCALTRVTLCVHAHRRRLMRRD